ncbi:MAG: RNA polymerase subunit sigma-24 [Pirellulales bacterium]|nr:RNA polymerase subunit sigma-24 [Pirellulales bacterium]
MQTPDFSELIRRVQGGDTAAVEEFLGRYEGAIRREIRFLLLDARLRQVVSESDVCQSVVIRFLVGLWSGKYEIGQPEELVGLLKKMVRARVADLARHWTAQRRDVRRNISTENARSVEGMAAEASPSQLVANAELLEEIKRRLSDRQQRILAMRQQRMTWAEIAGELGDTAGPEAVRKQYERALARVAEELGLEDLP